MLENDGRLPPTPPHPSSPPPGARGDIITCLTALENIYITYHGLCKLQEVRNKSEPLTLEQIVDRIYYMSPHRASSRPNPPRDHVAPMWDVQSGHGNCS